MFLRVLPNLFLLPFQSKSKSFLRFFSLIDLFFFFFFFFFFVTNRENEKKESVHFGDRATCILHMEVLHLVNVGDDPVEFFDVVIDNSFFHHSFKNTISVAPRGNLTIQVVFLPAIP
jgi:hypothetical protein